MSSPKSFRDHVLIDTATGKQLRPCKFIPHMRKLWCITGEKGTFRLTHVPTGLAAGPFLGTQKEVVANCHHLMDGVDLSAVDTSNGRKVAKVLQANYTSGASDRLAAAGLPVEEQSVEVEVEVRNRQTNVTRLYTVSMDDVIDGNHCTGPCCCTIEPDAVAPCGWPGTEDALARC